MMTLEEKHKLICKFMNYEPRKTQHEELRQYKIIDTPFDGNYRLKEMRFSTSYDWQMIVIMKIRRLGFHYQIGEIGEENARVVIQHPDWEEKISVSGNYDLLPAFIFEAIIRFIEFYYDKYINRILNQKAKSSK